MYIATYIPTISYAYKRQQLEYFYSTVSSHASPFHPSQPSLYMWLLHSIEWRHLQHCILCTLCLKAYGWLYNETLPQTNKLYYRIRHKLNLVPICTIDHVYVPSITKHKDIKT